MPTQNHVYNTPSKGKKDWHIPLNDNFEILDVEMEIRDLDANKSSYQPKQGAKFLAADTGIVYRGDGSNWIPEFVFASYNESAVDSVSVSVDGARALELTAEGGNTAGNVLAGHSSNNMGSGVVGATISGGGYDDGNLVLPNSITTNYGTIGGGFGNETDGDAATVSGGRENTSSAMHATVGGGLNNSASGNGATVSGGKGNKASGNYGTVTGGQDNEALADHATVAGGEGSLADAPHAFAAGKNARARHEGAIIFSDTSSGGLSSLNDNEFAVSASGGVFLFSNSAATTGVELPSGSGTWQSASSRSLKSNIEPVDGPTVLNKVTSLEIGTWNYDAQDEAVRHMGPMAEEFHDKFGLGTDERHISNVDADGVALAAIQGLKEKHDKNTETIVEQQEQIESLKAENDELRSKNQALRNRLDGIESRLDSLEASENVLYQ